jgi:hypothetical protein
MGGEGPPHELPTSPWYLAPPRGRFYSVSKGDQEGGGRGCAIISFHPQPAAFLFTAPSKSQGWESPAHGGYVCGVGAPASEAWMASRDSEWSTGSRPMCTGEAHPGEAGLVVQSSGGGLGRGGRAAGGTPRWGERASSFRGGGDGRRRAGGDPLRRRLGGVVCRAPWASSHPLPTPHRYQITK